MNEIQTVDDKLITDYLEAFGLAKNLTPQEVKQFAGISKAMQLNPFKREIYCVAYGKGDYRTLSIITGYETYLKRAERTGQLTGWKCWTEGEYKIEKRTVKKTGQNGDYNKEYNVPVGNLVAKIKITKKGWTEPFEHEVYLDEYAQSNEMWTKARTMLKKVCMAQGFKLAFPDELGGLPYTEEEVDRDITHEPTTEATVIQQLADSATPVQASPIVETKPAQPEPKAPPAVDPWIAEWNTRVKAMSKLVSKWPTPDREALELSALAKASQSDPALMDLAEKRAEIYAKYKDTDQIDSVMQAIKDAGRDLQNLIAADVAFEQTLPIF